MKIEKEEIIKYTTEDGNVFYDLDEAKEHERELLIAELYKKSHKVDEYIIYKIENQEELNVLVGNQDYCQTYVYFDIKKEITYPIWVCESTDDDCYYFNYDLLDNIILKHVDILDKLKAIQKMK